MQETAESVKEYGVLVPALARPREDGGYELIAGHRRKHACELAGLATMPVIVRDIDRDAATIIMVDSNLQRENILPSERAKAYKMKMEAIKRQGARTDLTSPKISAKFRSDDEVGQDAGVSGDTIRNYIALTQLVPELQQMVDEKKIALSPAYQIAALTPKEQGLLLETIDSEQAIHKYARREDVPEKTLFIITTDGYENASRHYDYERVRRMIERQKERYGWEFLFLGANIDAAKEAARFGIGADRSVNYKCDEAGTALNYEVISEAVCSVRAARPLSADWKRRIDEDVQKRGR